MKYLLLLWICASPFIARCQAGSEIYLFDLTEKKGEIMLTNARNITNHVGYDNQPSFHTKKPVLYYSSFNNEGRADIMSYNYKIKTTQSITVTPEREYSPSLTPDKKYVSCIIQRDNGIQDLGKYPVGGGDPVVLVDNLTVGYHVWADNNHVALFILGKDIAPNTLHYLQLTTKKDTILEENIGRSLHKVPNENAITYVFKASQSNWEIKKLNISTLQSETLATTLPGREDIAWSASGHILSSDGNKLYQLCGNKWKEIVLKESIPALKGITRLAVSPRGDKLAVVVSE
jgi:hypothetical protein